MPRVARVLGAFLLAVSVAAGARAQTPDPAQPAPKKPLGNINVLLFGVGTAQMDHPNFNDDVFPNGSYQRRIWRREMRHIPIWVRVGMNFLSEDRRFPGYVVGWQEGEIAVPDTVFEHTSDITFRGELLADVLHGQNFALYGGVGFGLHYLSFSSDGDVSAIPIFKENDNRLAPSIAAGGRVFSSRHSLTGYAEFRWLSVYGKTTAVLSESQPWLTRELFEFTSEYAWSVEGGLGFHW